MIKQKNGTKQKIFLDPNGEWQRIIEVQRKQQELNEMSEKEDQNLRKQRYREELQRLIDEQKLQNAMKNKQDQKLLGQMDKDKQEKDYQEYQKYFDLKQKAQEFAKYGLEQESMKKEQMRKSLQLERQRQLALQKGMQDAEQFDMISRIQTKERVKRDLTQSYKEQEEYKKAEQQIEKQREQEMMQQLNDRLKDQELQRQQVLIKYNKFLDKLKGGYGQNENVLKRYNDLYVTKELQQRELQKKMIEEAALEKQFQEYQRIQQEKAQKDKMKQDTLNTILNQMSEKQQHQREEINKRQRDYEVIQNIQQAYTKIERNESERKQQIQQQYRQELINQIEQDRQRKQQEGSMSHQEINMNRRIIDNSPLKKDDPPFIGAVPGLHIDHQRQKQKAYLDYQLNRSTVHPQQNGRARNISAFVTGSNITQNNIF